MFLLIYLFDHPSSLTSTLSASSSSPLKSPLPLLFTLPLTSPFGPSPLWLQRPPPSSVSLLHTSRRNHTQPLSCSCVSVSLYRLPLLLRRYAPPKRLPPLAAPRRPSPTAPHEGGSIKVPNFGAREAASFRGRLGRGRGDDPSSIKRLARSFFSYR